MKNFKIRIAIMKFNFLVLLFALGFFISCAYAQESQEGAQGPSGSPQLISMDFKDAGLKDVLKALSIQSGVNFIASQEIEDRTVTLYLDGVSAKEAMDKLFKASKLEYEYYEEDKIALIKKAEPIVETMTKVFPLKYAHVSSSSIEKDLGEGDLEELTKKISSGQGSGEQLAGISTVVQELLSAQGKLNEDPRTNSLIITDLPNRFPIIEKTIKELDIAVPQVMLEVEILDVSKDIVDKLGFNFESDGFGENPLTVILPGDFVQKDARFFMGNKSLYGVKKLATAGSGSMIFGNTFAGVLDLLRTQKDTRYLARPRILTLSNEIAEINITSNIVMQVKKEYQYDDSGNVTEVTWTPERSDAVGRRKDPGITLKVIPVINSDNMVTMRIEPAIRTITSSTIVADLESEVGRYYDLDERTTKTTVKVSDGETVIVGGLIHKDRSVELNKVPILGDIPIIGALFRHKNKDKDIERELLVFITPRIVENDSARWAGDNGMDLFSDAQAFAPEEARLSAIEDALDSFRDERY
ncbi:secretin N-terminal domain-containing protein [Candidatus Omnitrophota bacterium]